MTDTGISVLPGPVNTPDAATVAGARAMRKRMWNYLIAERTMDGCHVVLDRDVADIDTPYPEVFRGQYLDCMDFVDDRAFAAGRDAWLAAQWQPIEDLPPFDERPQRLLIQVEGWKEHGGSFWCRGWRGVAHIRREDQPDSFMEFRRSDMEQIMRDGDMDGIDRVTHWRLLPAPPASTGDAA